MSGVGVGGGGASLASPNSTEDAVPSGTSTAAGRFRTLCVLCRGRDGALGEIVLGVGVPRRLHPESTHSYGSAERQDESGATSSPAFSITIVCLREVRGQGRPGRETRSSGRGAALGSRVMPRHDRANARRAGASRASAAVPSLWPSLRALGPMTKSRRSHDSDPGRHRQGPCGDRRRGEGPVRGTWSLTLGVASNGGAAKGCPVGGGAATQPPAPRKAQGPGWGRVGWDEGATARSAWRGLTTVSRPYERRVGMLETAGGRGHPESLRNPPPRVRTPAARRMGLAAALGRGHRARRLRLPRVWCRRPIRKLSGCRISAAQNEGVDQQNRAEAAPRRLALPEPADAGPARGVASVRLPVSRASAREVCGRRRRGRNTAC